MKNNWTGERLETFIYNENTLEHLHRYAIALHFSKGKNVLDIACGEGYGSNILAGEAANVVGVDISCETIQAARKKYQAVNLDFREGSAAKIPSDNHVFDVVVSFETIEHHDQHEAMLQEIRRVLKKDGLLIISTPDKATYTDKRNFVNKHHVKELYKNEFKDLVNRYFDHTEFLYQRTDFCSLVVPENDQEALMVFKGDYDHIEYDSAFDALYIICIASDIEMEAFKRITMFSNAQVYQSIIRQAVDNIKHSASYKIGSFLLTPFRYLRRLTGKPQ